MPGCVGSSSAGPRPRAQAGSSAIVALLLLLVVAAALGWNYHRNYQIDQSADGGGRPFAKFSTEDLALMAEGYRLELAEAKQKQIGGRVGTQDRHFFDEKIQEFERVQRETRRVRDRSIAVKEIQDKLDLVEAEQRRRVRVGGVARVHLERLFRI